MKITRQPNLFLGGTGLLVLLRTTNLLGTVLLLLALLTTTLGSLSHTLTNKTELGLELLGSLNTVIDNGEASALTTTKSELHAKDKDGILVSLVHGGKLFTEVNLANTSGSRMDNIDNLQEDKNT